MTGLQIYGLVAPYALLALALLGTWLNHRDIVRSRHGKHSRRARPAE